MDTISVVVSCPIDTYSGYGARSRDFVKGLLSDKKYDVKILSQRWGNTRFGYLKDHNENDLSSRIIPNMTQQPDIWVQITVPNEFQPVGKFNIGVTAGMETTVVHHTWIEGCNRMNLVLTSSNHSKSVFETTTYEKKDKNTGQNAGMIRVETPVEVLLEGVDLDKYFSKPTTELDLSQIDESFCYLSVGHWMQGDFGHDRKNIGYTVKSFLEAFKNKPQQPALILKTLQVNTSIMDREAILDKLADIRRSVKGKLPNVYLLHGEISDQQMNQLYNHPKVKVMVSHAKGEGYGRPLLEFSVVGKPVIASGWSGQIDFLQKDKCVLIGGSLHNVHPSAAQKDMILQEAQWFQPDDGHVAKAYKETYKSYKKFAELAKQQKHFSKTNFSMEVMTKKLHEILDKNLPEFPKQINLTLPKLNLPKLQKIDG